MRWFRFINIALIIHETGAINPYRYQGEYQKYFIGTGDYIRGLTFDTSTTNAVLCAFGVIYFLTRNNIMMVLINMTVLLLTGSNYVNLALLMVLALLFFFKSSRNQKSVILICVMFLVVFMAKISPQNNKYVVGSISNLYRQPRPNAIVNPLTAPSGTMAAAVLSPEEIKRKFAQHYIDSICAVSLSGKKAAIEPLGANALARLHVPTETGRIIIARPDINTVPYQTPTDTSLEERRLLTFIGTHKSSLPLSRQTIFKPCNTRKIYRFFANGGFFTTSSCKNICRGWFG